MERLDAAINWALGHLGVAERKRVKISPLAHGGSGRQYFRLEWGGKKVLLMLYDATRRENTLYVPVGRFLAQIGVPVPHIFAEDEKEGIVILEDLGDRSLFSSQGRSRRELLKLYRKAVSALGILHRYPPHSFPPHLTLMEGFDEHLYRWERDYFCEHLVRRYLGLRLSPKEEEALEQELEMLAFRLLSLPSTLIHRDFQSQNIMIYEGEPFFIDFQGMRKGNPLYDVASLVYDPYMAWGQEERLQVAEFYYEFMALPFGWEEYLLYLREAAAQRLMQALGAYAYLGCVKGYRSFLAYVPAGLENLFHVTSEVPALKRLNELVQRLDMAWPRG
ncbi:MAG TPA: phosphotransferase [Syntrophales bacterium]|nr:phosphotransferase [Syntrophales bacterium]HOL60067.1 phosphotransferase [Syntrophales bacterium]HPO36177.1 phosphotransferase [Syntrophales bacterium]